MARSLLLLEGEREESRIRELSARLCEEFSVHEEVSLCHCFNLAVGAWRALTGSSPLMRLMP